MSETLKQFDHSPLSTNQATIIILLISSFILNTPWLVTLVAIAMVLGTILGNPGFGFIYTSVLKKWGVGKTRYLPR